MKPDFSQELSPSLSDYPLKRITQFLQGSLHELRQPRLFAKAGLAISCILLSWAVSTVQAGTKAITKTADDGTSGTLRWVSEQANATAGIDETNCTIPGTESYTITSNTFG